MSVRADGLVFPPREEGERKNTSDPDSNMKRGTGQRWRCEAPCTRNKVWGSKGTTLSDCETVKSPVQEESPGNNQNVTILLKYKLKNSNLMTCWLTTKSK